VTVLKKGKKRKTGMSAKERSGDVIVYCVYGAGAYTTDTQRPPPPSPPSFRNRSGLSVHRGMPVCVVCVCVRERERERERNKASEHEIGKGRENGREQERASVRE
jgi:hypothetical protein